MKSTDIVKDSIHSINLSRLQAQFYATWVASGTRQSQSSWLASLRVGELMGQPAVCVDSRTSLREARRLMKEHGVRRLPVVADGRLVGIVTLGDIRGAWPSEVTTLNRSELDYLINEVPVERVMNRDVITVIPGTRLVEAARLMIDHQIGGLPVLSGEGRVLGVITESDIFRALDSLVDLDHGLAFDANDRRRPPDADEELR